MWREAPESINQSQHISVSTAIKPKKAPHAPSTPASPPPNHYSSPFPLTSQPGNKNLLCSTPLFTQISRVIAHRLKTRHTSM